MSGSQVDWEGWSPFGGVTVPGAALQQGRTSLGVCIPVPWGPQQDAHPGGLIPLPCPLSAFPHLGFLGTHTHEPRSLRPEAEGLVHTGGRLSHLCELPLSYGEGSGNRGVSLS